MSETEIAPEAGDEIPTPAPARTTLASTAAEVTLFEDRAEVVRRARAVLAAGTAWIRIGGVSALVDDSSVVARVREGEGRVLGTRVVRRVREATHGDAGELAASEADRDAARASRERTERAVSRAESEEERAADLAEHWMAGLSRAPRGGAKAATDWRATFAAIDAALTRALDEVAAARAALEAARLDEARADLRYRQARLVAPRYETTVEVQVESPAAAEREIELVYRTPCALWRPEHLMRLNKTEKGAHEIEVVTMATAWQATGETWADVRCRFSTARPAQQASPPLLSDDVLELRQKTEAEKREVVVEARDQTIAVAGLARGARAVDEMPGVDDGGEPQWFAPERPVTLPSDGQPARVEIARAALPCTVERVAFPERSQGVYQRATATLSGKRPLLAGPVRVARGGELVGRSRVSFVAPGEPFELAFGVDDGVRVRRRVDEERDTAALTGTQRITRTVHLFLSNLSGDARALTVSERVPVSEIKDVTISVLDKGGATVDERDGFARFTLDLPGGATRELTLKYRIEAASKVRLPF